jgi:hypothetical protein
MLDTIRWQILFVALAGRVNRRQLDLIAYLREENRLLKEHVGGRRRVGRPGVLREIRALTEHERNGTVFAA